MSILGKKRRKKPSWNVIVCAIFVMDLWGICVFVCACGCKMKGKILGFCVAWVLLLSGIIIVELSLNFLIHSSAGLSLKLLPSSKDISMSVDIKTMYQLK